MNIDQVQSDLAAFADDDEDVAIDASGQLMIVRSGQDVTARIIDDASRGLMVEVDDVRMTYDRFVTHHLARLDVFAERLLAKRVPPDNYVDGPAELESAGPREGPAAGNTNSALDILQQECREGSPFTTRVVFITADAGHGKTVLLREHQHRQAQAFIQGRASYLFWHVDLQGRQLVRLSEALMGDLGDLRVPSLWMPAVLKLIQKRALVLAIDGFDELAAEQGSTDALGALAVLVRQLDGRGVVVAASRRTFFDTEDYLTRAGLVRRSVAGACEFDQLSLLPWKRQNVMSYFSEYEYQGSRLGSSEETYDSLLTELGGDVRHPMLTRPFLVSQVARALALYDWTPSTFVRGMEDPLKGVAALVQAFVEREVAEKWRHRESGEPYLTVDQHMEFLSTVADEMHQAQKDRLSLEIVETLATILLDKWGIDSDKRQNVIRMVRMHVLLTVPPDGSPTSRSFDHTEFRDYFVAHSLRSQLDDAASTGRMGPGLVSTLSVAQLTDSTARYVSSMLDLGPSGVRNLVESMARVGRDEWRPTFLQANLGTLMPFLIDSVDFDDLVEFDGKAVFSSLVLENSHLHNIAFRNCVFLNTSFGAARWDHVEFTNCSFNDISIDVDIHLESVILKDCEFTGLRVVDAGEEVAREYAPTRVKTRLASAGFAFNDPEPMPLAEIEESPFHKQVARALRMFRRTTVITTKTIQLRFGADFVQIISEVVPLLEQHGIVEERRWRGSGTDNLWSLTCSLDEVLADDEEGAQGRFSSFWRDVASHK